jgi:hypothetical protein
MEVDLRTIFSFSGYAWGKKFLGRIAGNEFCLHKRRYWVTISHLLFTEHDS